MPATKMATITKLKADMVEEYIRLHDEIWDEVVRLGHEAGLRNFTIYRHGLYLFSTYEYIGDNYEKDMAWKNAHEVIKKWQDATGACTDFVTEDIKTVFLEEIFHNDF